MSKDLIDITVTEFLDYVAINLMVADGINSCDNVTENNIQSNLCKK